MRRERLVAQCTPCSSAKPQSTSRVDRRDASVSSVERAVSETGRSVAEPLKRRRNQHLCSTATLAASVRNSTKKFPRSNEAHKIACVGTRSTASAENNVTHATGARKTQADILVKERPRQNADLRDSSTLVSAPRTTLEVRNAEDKLRDVFIELCCCT